LIESPDFTTFGAVYSEVTTTVRHGIYKQIELGSSDELQVYHKIRTKIRDIVDPVRHILIAGVYNAS
jgi:hypothetical protein